MPRATKVPKRGLSGATTTLVGGGSKIVRFYNQCLRKGADVASIQTTRDGQIQKVCETIFSRFGTPSILDLGCGKMRLLNALMRRNEGEWTYLGIDLEDPASVYGREFRILRRFEHERDRWKVDSSRGFRESAQKFDVVVLMNVIHETSLITTASLIQDARIHLKEDGILLLVDISYLSKGEPRFVPYFAWDARRMFSQVADQSYVSKRKGIPVLFCVVERRHILPFSETLAALVASTNAKLDDLRSYLAVESPRVAGIPNPGRTGLRPGTGITLAYATMAVTNAAGRLRECQAILESSRAEPRYAQCAFSLLNTVRPGMLVDELFSVLGRRYDYYLIDSVIQELDSSCCADSIDVARSSPVLSASRVHAWTKPVRTAGLQHILRYGLSDALAAEEAPSTVTQTSTSTGPSDVTNRLTISFVELSPAKLTRVERPRVTALITGTPASRVRRPYVPFDLIEDANFSAGSVFLTGIAGAGKSRLLFERISRQLCTAKRLFVVGSKRLLQRVITAVDGVQIHSLTLSEFARRVSTTSTAAAETLLVWDGFPAGLDGASVEQCAGALRRLSSVRGIKLSIALAADRFSWANRLSQVLASSTVRRIDVRWNRGQFGALIEALGLSYVGPEVFERAVRPELAQVTEALYQRLNIPRVVETYYSELVRSPNVDPFSLVFTFEDPVSDASARLHILSRLHGRGSPNPVPERDQQFLYVLGLANSIGADSSIEGLRRLQFELFQTYPMSPQFTLSEFFSDLGRGYHMHDAFRQALTYDNDVLTSLGIYFWKTGFENCLASPLELGWNFFGFETIGSFLVGANKCYDFSELVDAISVFYSQNSAASHDVRYNMGGLLAAFGRRLNHLDDSQRSEVYRLLTHTEDARWGFGEGLANGLQDFDESTFLEVLELARQFHDLALSLGTSLATVYMQRVIPQTRLRSLLKASDSVGLGFASIAERGGSLPDAQRDGLLDLLRGNQEFAEQFVERCTNAFTSISDSGVSWIESLRTTRWRHGGEIRFRLGYSAGIRVVTILEEDPPRSKLQARDLRYILRVATLDSKFADGLGYRIGESLESLSEHSSDLIALTRGRNAVAEGIGAGFAAYYQEAESRLVTSKPWSGPDQQTRDCVLKLTSSNSKVVQGLGRVWKRVGVKDPWQQSLLRATGSSPRESSARSQSRLLGERPSVSSEHL